MRPAAYFLLHIALLFGLLGCGVSRPSGGPGSHLALRHLGNGICQDTVRGTMWQIEASPTFFSWEQARQYAEALTLGGYTDWRLPSRGELYELHDLLALKMPSDCAILEVGGYWSAAEQGGGNAGYWDTYPLCGDFSYEYIKRASGAVRAVRP